MSSPSLYSRVVGTNRPPSSRIGTYAAYSAPFSRNTSWITLGRDATAPEAVDRPEASLIRLSVSNALCSVATSTTRLASNARLSSQAPPPAKAHARDARHRVQREAVHAATRSAPALLRRSASSRHRRSAAGRRRRWPSRRGPRAAADRAPWLPACQAALAHHPPRRRAAAHRVLRRRAPLRAKPKP